MATQTKSVHKKLGRPAGRLYRETIPVRLTEDAVAAIDAWAAANKVSRSEAIRRILDEALPPLKPRRQGKST